MGDSRHGNAVHAYFQFVKLSRRRGRRLKAQDVHDLLFAEESIQVVRQIVRVAKDVTTRRLGQEEEPFVGVDLCADLQIVLHAHAADVDGVKHDIGSAK